MYDNQWDFGLVVHNFSFGSQGNSFIQMIATNRQIGPDFFLHSWLHFTTMEFFRGFLQ